VATFGSSGHYKCEAVNDAGSDRKDMSLLVLGELHYHHTFPQWDRQKMLMPTTGRNIIRSHVSDNITELYLAFLWCISTIFVKFLVRYAYIQRCFCTSKHTPHPPPPPSSMKDK
jgi:hypothetical protein